MDTAGQVDTAQQDKPQHNLLVLVGPTAVGKTALSLKLAECFDCEIISGDSMQVYRGMDIGTAKATPEERAKVPHHLIDIRDPDEAYSVSDFQEECTRAIEAIASRGKLPFIVGGTGLYIQSVVYGYRFSEAGQDETFRQELRAYAETHGAKALHDRLRKIDPASADRLHVNDIRRVIRALEVYHLTGRTLTEYLAEQPKESPYHTCIIGLTMERSQLYRNIEQRVDLMIEQGLIEEVQRLLDSGYGPGLISMQGLGYKEIIGYLLGEYNREHAIELLKRNTRRFAKRQLSWFRHMRGVIWIDVTDRAKFDSNLARINDIIRNKFYSDA